MEIKNYYIQCPHCQAFMSILGVSKQQAKWNCQNDKCKKIFKARIVEKIIEYVEVTHELEFKL